MGDTTNDSAECFVCMEVAPRHELLKTCRCDRLVHRQCFERLICEVEAHATRCPICTEAYAMCTIGQMHRVGCRTSGVMLVFSYGSIVALSCFVIALSSVPVLPLLILMLFVSIALTSVYGCMFGPVMTEMLRGYCFTERQTIRIPRLLASSSCRIRRLFVTLRRDELSISRVNAHPMDSELSV